MANTHLLRGDLSVGHHEAERTGVLAVQISRGEIVAVGRALSIGNRECGCKGMMGFSINSTIVAFTALGERDSTALSESSQGCYPALL